MASRVVPTGRRMKGSENPPKLMLHSAARCDGSGISHRSSSVCTASRGLSRVLRRTALLPLCLERKVDHHDRVFLHDPHQQHDADQSDDLKIQSTKLKGKERSY